MQHQKFLVKNAPELETQMYDSSLCVQKCLIVQLIFQSINVYIIDTRNMR